MLPLAKSCQEADFFIPKQNIVTPNSLRELSVGYKDKRFFIQLPSGEKKYVQLHDLSGGLKNISCQSSLEKVLQVGKIHLTAAGQDYKLRLGISAKGGGPICGAIAYWGTKAVIYGSIAGAAGATGGIAGAALGSMMTTAAGGGLAAAAVSGAASHIAAGSAVAVAETTAAIGGTLGIAGTFTAIEGTAATVSMFFTALPFCP